MYISSRIDHDPEPDLDCDPDATEIHPISDADCDPDHGQDCDSDGQQNLIAWSLGHLSSFPSKKFHQNLFRTFE